MIYFFADEHYQMFPGRTIYEHLPENLRRKIAFHENDWDFLEKGSWESDCELLILHMIGGTCNQPLPGDGAERAVRRYCERGGNILLLHGSSAAFWPWRWWREIVGFRWVRPNDPDNPQSSTHPQHPCEVVVAKTRHRLAAKLQNFTLPEDEIYIRLEQTAPAMTLMETTIAEGTFPQCAEAVNIWGGKMFSFIPGHKPVAASNEKLLNNIQTAIEYLTEE
ncbi:MAG: ThuA domain-containing protein [Victivallaceae bacterium]|nr:ThuA domain-containing protein [Victivallaceae bacterium]